MLKDQRGEKETIANLIFSGQNLIHPYFAEYEVSGLWIHRYTEGSNGF